MGLAGGFGPVFKIKSTAVLFGVFIMTVHVLDCKKDLDVSRHSS